MVTRPGPGDGQADVAEGHEEGAGPDGPDLPDDPVAEPAAEKRHEIAEGQEEAVGVALAAVGPAEDLVHVEDEDGHERVEADALPHLGEEDEGQGAGVFLQHRAAFRGYAIKNAGRGQTEKINIFPRIPLRVPGKVNLFRFDPSC